jgi:thiaminase/transcriptional activator TenA
VTTTTATFTDRLRVLAQPIWAKQLQHPFVQALGDGTLPRETFAFYIRQDARFLDQMAKVFAFALTRADDRDEMQHWGERALHTLAVEKGLHHKFAARFGVSVDEMTTTPMAPTTYAYTRHLLHVAATGSLPAILTVVLPCAWIYAEVGRHFTALTGGSVGADHPYGDWLSTYASDEFEQVGAWLRAQLNARARDLPEQELQRLEEIFIISSRYEYMFWDMAWRQETWVV